jgi:hypothetical protein
MASLSTRSADRLSFLKFALALVVLLLPGHSFGQSSPTYESVAIDSLDPDAWNGIVFLAKAFQQPSAFALRIGSWHWGFLDGEQIFDAVREVGPHAPDASYCRVSWRHPPRNTPVTLEWSRINQTTVVGRLTAEKDFQFVLETYFPPFGAGWGAPGRYSVDESHQAMIGERNFDNIFGTESRFVVMVDRPLTGSGAYPSLAQLRQNMEGSGKLVSAIMDNPHAGAAGLEFAGGAVAHFVATLGWEKDALIRQGQELLAPGKIDAILKEKAESYATRRPAVKGLFEGAPEAIGNSMFWNTVYAPSNNLIFPSTSRHWAHAWGGWAVGEWDCFFDSLLTSLEDKAQTEAGIKAILLAQADSGLVPNVASGIGTSPDRSQPPVGSYLTWKIFQRTQDRALLAWAYPRLKRWHEWWFRDRGDGQPWRDGNRDGLLEWGSNRGSTATVGGGGFAQAAQWESGIDDNPMYDHVTFNPRTYTMELDDVGLNALYALDAECLAGIAAILGKDDDAKQFNADCARVKQTVREKLWNDQDGIFENRFWNGEFSKRLSPTNFYPLTAGIATPEQAKSMVEKHLLNTQEFWGTYVMPSIARNDPAFPGQFYVRGNIWGPLNYLVYQGLNRYGFDRVALEYAQKNYDLFMDDWRLNQHDNEQYNAWGGFGGGDPHYTWGALLCLVALEQYIDKNPWEGLRFGALSPASNGEFRGSTWEGHTYDVAVGPAKSALTRDGTLRFEASAGVVVRKYQSGPSQLTFTLKSEKPAHLKTWEFNSGELGLRVDGKPAGSVRIRGGVGEFDVPAGEHSVELNH